MQSSLGCQLSRERQSDYRAVSLRLKSVDRLAAVVREPAGECSTLDVVEDGKSFEPRLADLTRTLELSAPAQFCEIEEHDDSAHRVRIAGHDVTERQRLLLGIQNFFEARRRNVDSFPVRRDDRKPFDLGFRLGELR